MKTLLAGLVALTTTAFAQGPVAPEPPALKDVLKLANPQVVIFRPVTMGRGQSLNVTHIRMGDGSVKPGAAVQLVVYSKEPNLQGGHDVLFQDFHHLGKDGSPVLAFDSFTPAEDANSKGIIAVLIGLLQPVPNGPARPFNLPLNDIVSAEITDGTVTGLLLPAVQKVRSAAAR
jgi:hypothetical protein